jgi:hypothetical protein
MSPVMGTEVMVEVVMEEVVMAVEEDVVAEEEMVEAVEEAAKNANVV